MSLCYYYVVVELDISIMSSEIAGYDRRRPYQYWLSNAPLDSIGASPPSI